MKWLIIQSDGEHKGQDSWCPNWYLRECYVIQHAFQQNGHAANIWGLRHDNFGVVPCFENYDGLFLIENYEFGWLPDFSKIVVPLKVQWIIDLHYQPWEVYIPISDTMDIVLHSTRRYIPGYRSRTLPSNHIWFPNGVDDRYFDAHSDAFEPVDKENYLIFIGGRGHNTRRDSVLAQMERHAGLKYSYGITGKNYISAVRKAKIQFNVPIHEDINYRTFETIGLGTCLLTEYDDCLLELGFQHNYNCLLYRTVYEAIELAEKALADGSWKFIGEQGYLLSKRHSYTERIRKFLHDKYKS